MVKRKSVSYFSATPCMSYISWEVLAVSSLLSYPSLQNMTFSNT